MEPLFDMNPMLRLEIELMSQAVQLRCVRGNASQSTAYRPTGERSRPITVGHGPGPFVGFLRCAYARAPFPWLASRSQRVLRRESIPTLSERIIGEDVGPLHGSCRQSVAQGVIGGDLHCTDAQLLRVSPAESVYSFANDLTLPGPVDDDGH